MRQVVSGVCRGFLVVVTPAGGLQVADLDGAPNA
jgi:hypothetical protein